METSSTPPANPAEYLSIAQAAKNCPGRVGGSSVRRWCDRGIKARNGTRIRLRCIRVGGKIYTTAAWLDEYFADCQVANRTPEPVPLPTPAKIERQQRRSHEDAKRELALS